MEREICRWARRAGGVRGADMVDRVGFMAITLCKLTPMPAGRSIFG